MPSIAVAVATAVADCVGVDAITLPPLSDVVDPDALDRLFSRSVDGSAGVPVEVYFQYSGVDVVVEGDRTVTVEPAGRASHASEGAT